MGRSFDFYLPVREATVFCHSKLLDDIGDFTKFVIWNLGEHKTASDVNQVIQLPPEILAEELEYLSEHGLSVGSAKDGWKLSALGQEYFALLQCINSLEKDGIPAYIDMSSGSVTARTDGMSVICETEIPADALVVPSKGSVSDVFFRNDNYGNSLAFVQDHLRKEKLLEERYMSSLYTTMRVLKDTHSYARCRAEAYSYGGPVQEQGLKIAVPIARVTFKKFYNQLDEYRPVLDTLSRLRQYGNGLLSDKALCIEEVYQQECAEPQVVYYFDQFARQRIKELQALTRLTDTDHCTDPRCIRLPAEKLCFELRTEHMVLKPIDMEENKSLVCSVSYFFCDRNGGEDLCGRQKRS